MMRRHGYLLLCLVLGACAHRAPSANSVALPAAPPPGEPAGTLGLSMDAVRAAFGTPAFTRKDGTTELWRYDSAACRAFFFFDGQKGGMSVRHVETLPHGDRIAADTTCLATFRKPQPVS